MRGIGSIGTLTEFWKITKELNPQGIEQEATRSFRIVIAGDPSVDLNWLRDALTEGRPRSAAVATAPLTSDRDPVSDLPSADLYIYVAKPGARLSRNEADVLHRIDAKGHPVILVLTKESSSISDEEMRFGAELVWGTIPPHRIAVIERGNPQDVDDNVLPTVLEAVPHLELSLARELPGFRTTVAQQLIREISRVNAEFALLSSIPANIPIVGTLVATGADTIVLTKNQVMMLFKLAAIHDRDLAARVALVAEIVPVVGGAFLWRSVARTLAGMLPGIVSVVPKTLVAALGTYVVGSIALYYYQTGCRPDADAIARFRIDGLGRASDLLPDILKRITELPR